MKLEAHQLGTVLRQLRQQRKLTQQAAADQAKLARSRLAALESGHATNLELTTLQKLLDVYDAEIRIEPRTPRPSLNQILRDRDRT